MYAYYKPADYIIQPTGKFMLFDLDGTLAFSRSGKTHSNSAADTIIHPRAQETIAEITDAGYNILIVSNQSYWTPEVRQKMQHLLQTLQQPIMVATGHKSPYRKPAPALWLKYLELIGQPEVQELHMCGDAAGPDSAHPPYRWASSDRDFAQAIGAHFHEPRDLIATYEPPTTFPRYPTITLMVGNPGSGKSTMARDLAAAAGHELLEQDKYPSRAKLLKVVAALLEAGKSVIVDATHGSKERRDELYAIADKHDAVKRVFWRFTDGRAFNTLRLKPIPPVAYGVYTKRFADPRDDGVPVELCY